MLVQLLIVLCCSFSFQINEASFAPDYNTDYGTDYDADYDADYGTDVTHYGTDYVADNDADYDTAQAYEEICEILQIFLRQNFCCLQGNILPHCYI